jgi:hypothetical protein
MKERPILMHARSINGILEGRKTQTRRIIKIPQVYLSGYGASIVKMSMVDGEALIEGWPKQEREMGNFGRCQRIKSPYGQPGDRLWVRENWMAGIALYDPKKVFMCVYLDINGKVSEFDKMAPDVPPESRSNALAWKKKPSIHMPRWASRLTLEVLSIDVQRVQDISEADAKAEGCQIPEVMHADEPVERYDYRTYFRALWDDTNGKGAWERNDWCWVVDFKRIEA